MLDLVWKVGFLVPHNRLSAPGLSSMATRALARTAPGARRGRPLNYNRFVVCN